ncbi:DUF952 domain-containing protein [Dactylosporangium roseum]|uniref:DUF952 domain-containing protein n=2 Tax=Dactylosporangium roseum TaxID=47989 RepID=A0ABY5ZEW8_9ACTN|nr:DUF952 domain-containing protein [Dactylosporangium roseum]
MGAVARGLGAGVASVAAALGVGWAILASAPPDPPCDSDLACLPHLGPVIDAVLAFPVVVAVVGPLAGRLLRVPRPWWLAAPAAWAVVLACVGLGPADGQAHWPFSSALSCLAILLLPYGLIAWWTSRPAPGETRAAAPLYKILLPDEWAQFDASGRFDGSPFDRASGHVQLCTRDQVVMVAGHRFAGAGPLMLVAVRADAFGERLRWEMMPDGRTYPHLDGPLTTDAVVGLYRVEGTEAIDAMLPRHGAKAAAGRAWAARSTGQ